MGEQCVALRANVFGAVVICAMCGQQKKPIGRSAGIGGPSMCDYYCEEYHQPPYVGSLWPNESEEDFGYPVGNQGIHVAEVLSDGE